MNLGLVQGFTDRMANVTGTLQADVRVTGSGADPHFVGFIDIRNGAFGVPLGGVSYSGLNTRINLTEDHVRLQEFQILDEHGAMLRVSGELGVHERQVGAVNITIVSDNFEIIDNELGDVGVDASLKITGELRRPKIAGSVKLEDGAPRSVADPAAVLRSVRHRGDSGGRLGGADRRRERQRRGSDEGRAEEGADAGGSR